MRILPLLLCLSLLSGCGWMRFWESEPDATAPAELRDFEEEVRVREQWSRGVGDGQDPLFTNLRPALGAGLVVGAGSDGTVTAMAADSGKPRWRRELDAPLSGGVGLGGGLVLVGDLEGQLYALDAQTGATRWQRSVGQEVLSAPAANDDLVVVQTINDRLLALDADSGRDLWRYNADSPKLSLRGTGSPLVTDTMVIAGLANGKVLALAADSGTVLWEVRVAVPKGRTELERMSDVDGAPILVDDVIYVTSYQGRAAALSRGTGRELWYQEFSSYKSPEHGLDQVFVTAADDTVAALRANSGQELWSNADLTYRQLTAPVYVNGYLAVADADGYLHVLSPVDGRLIGRTKVDGSGVAAPMITDGERLYALDNDGEIHAYTFKAR